MMSNKALLLSLAGHVLVIGVAGAVTIQEADGRQGSRIVLAAEILQEPRIPSMAKAPPQRPQPSVCPATARPRPQSRSMAAASSGEKLLASAATDAAPMAGREEHAAGRGGGAQQSTVPHNPQRIGESAPGSGNVKQSYYAAVTARLESAKGYPKEARRRGYEGTVLVRVELERNGTLRACAVLHGSGRDILDREALQTVRRAAPFPPVPDLISGAVQAMSVPLSYTLK